MVLLNSELKQQIKSKISQIEQLERYYDDVDDIIGIFQDDKLHESNNGFGNLIRTGYNRAFYVTKDEILDFLFDIKENREIKILDLYKELRDLK